MECIEHCIFKQHIWTFCNLAQNSFSDVFQQLIFEFTNLDTLQDLGILIILALKKVDSRKPDKRPGRGGRGLA